MDNQAEPQILSRADGATIAYHKVEGKSPGVMFLAGFKSDMTGGKALALEDYCRSTGRAFLRFDYTGHGQSSGAFEDGTIGDWTADAVSVLDGVADGPQVLVGSSMGGWIMLLTALARPDRIAGLLGIAAASDFTEDLIWNAFTDNQRAAMETDGFVDIPNCYEDQEPYRISHELVVEGRRHLLLDREIPLDVPVRLIHGMLDEDVPWPTSQRIAERLRSEDVETTFVKRGDHRLSEPHDLDRLCRVLAGLLENVETRPQSVA